MKTMKKGFSLLEVVVAVALLAGVLFSVGVLIPRAVMHMRNYGYQARGVELAEQLMEEIRGLDAPDIVSGTYDGSNTSGRNIAARRFPPTPYPTYTAVFQSGGQEVRKEYRFTVNVAPVAPGSTLRRVQVTTTWIESHGGEDVNRSWSVSSYVTP